MQIARRGAGGVTRRRAEIVVYGSLLPSRSHLPYLKRTTGDSVFIGLDESENVVKIQIPQTLPIAQIIVSINGENPAGRQTVGEFPPSLRRNTDNPIAWFAANKT